MFCLRLSPSLLFRNTIPLFVLGSCIDFGFLYPAYMSRTVISYIISLSWRWGCVLLIFLRLFSVNYLIVNFICVLTVFGYASCTFSVMYVVYLLTVSMSSNSSCSVSTRFCSSTSWLIFSDPTVLVSTLDRLLVVHRIFLSTSTSTLMLLITILWTLLILTWLMTVTSVTRPSLFIRI